MTHKEFKFTLWMMGFTVGGVHSTYYVKNNTIWLIIITHWDINTNIWIQKYPEHYAIRTTSIKNSRNFKQLHGYQRIINYLIRQSDQEKP